MTHREMLEKLGLKEEEFHDLLRKFVAFVGSLNENQKRLVRDNMPTVEESARSFGPDVSIEDFKKFCGPEVGATGMGCFEIGDDEEL